MADPIFNVLFLCTGTPHARSSPKASFEKKVEGAFASSRPEATLRALSIPSPSRCLKATTFRLMTCGQKAGTNLQRPARPRWISSSQSATLRQPRRALSGRASR